MTFGAVLGAIGAAVEHGFAKIGGGVGEVVGVNDAAAEFRAADGCVGLGEEELSGAIVEVEAVGGLIPAPGAKGTGVEGLAKTAGGFGRCLKGLLETLGGLALELAGSVGDGDLGGEIFGKARVVHGDGGLSGDGSDEGLAIRVEDGRLGMAVEDGAECLAGAADDGRGQIAADREMTGRHAVVGGVVAEAGILRDVAGAKNAAVNHGLSKDSRRARRGKAGECGKVDARDLVKLIGAAVLADAVIEEGSESGSAEFQPSVKGDLNNDVNGALVREEEPGFNQQAEVLCGLRERGRIASC